MAEETIVAQPGTGSPAPSPTLPEDYEELKAYRAQYDQAPAIYSAIQQRPEVLNLLRDEEEYNFYKTAYESRKQFLEQQKPKLTPELEMVRDEFKGELGPIVEYIQSERKQKEDAAKAEQEAAQQANVAYAQRLTAERPDLAEENYAGMHALAALASRDKVSLEDAWKRYGSRFAGSAPKKEPPPSLRGGEAAPGIPGPSSEPRIRNMRDITKRLSQNLRAAGMKG